MRTDMCIHMRIDMHTDMCVGSGMPRLLEALAAFAVGVTATSALLFLVWSLTRLGDRRSKVSIETYGHDTCGSCGGYK